MMLNKSVALRSSTVRPAGARRAPLVVRATNDPKERKEAGPTRSEKVRQGEMIENQKELTEHRHNLYDKFQDTGARDGGFASKELPKTKEEKKKQDEDGDDGISSNGGEYHQTMS